MKIETNDYLTEVTINHRGTVYHIDLEHHLEGMWFFYKAEDSYDVFDKDIMRGRVTVATSKTTILKKCIDKLIEEENKEYLAKRGVN